MKKQASILVRIAFYITGFLIMTLGIAISVKSNLGVSPVSSIPYTMTCVWGIEMGFATILFHIALVLIQIILLRRNFKIKNLLQIPAGVLFGYFTTFCNYLMTFFPNPTNIIIKLIMMLASAFFIAFGIFLYVPADIIPLAGEGTMLAVSDVTKIKFSTIKLCFDISMVTISLITCLAFIHALGSVGVGTIIAAVLVGTMLKLITRFFGNYRDSILQPGNEEETAAADTPLTSIMKTDVYSLASHTSLKDALTFLTEHKISGAPVINQNGELTGFITDGDIMRYLSSDHSLFVNDTDINRVTFNEKLTSLLDKKVEDIATRHIVTVDVNASLSDVCAIMAEHHLKKAPVMKEGKMVGVINVSNVMKYVVKLMNE